MSQTVLALEMLSLHFELDGLGLVLHLCLLPNHVLPFFLLHELCLPKAQCLHAESLLVVGFEAHVEELLRRHH